MSVRVGMNFRGMLIFFMYRVFGVCREGVLRKGVIREVFWVMLEVSCFLYCFMLVEILFGCK